MNITKSTLALGATLAIAAASITAVPSIALAGSEEAKVHCFGVNVCKGHNDCKSANNACKGQGSCKGLGFVNLPKPICDQIGGTVQ